MLPKVNNSIKKNRSQSFEIHGINFSDLIQPGDMVDSQNISAHRYPYISTRQPREKSEDYINVTAMAASHKLVVIEGTDVYYGGEKVEGLVVTEGEKQIISINSKICIYPDNKYFDIKSDGTPGEWHKLIPDDFYFDYHDFINTGSILYAYSGNYDKNSTSVYFRACTGAGTYAMTLAGTYDTGSITEASLTYLRQLDKQFTAFGEVNRQYTLRGSYGSSNSFTLISRSKPSFYSYTENKSGDTVLGAALEIVFQGIDASLWLPETSTTLTFGSIRTTYTGAYPDMDYVCVHDNRVFCCCNSDQSIHVSALGDPMVFDQFSGVSTDSYVTNVASPGNFTGCCEYNDSVLFFKEDVMYKLVGDYPAEYYLYTYNYDGVKDGAYKSMAILNERLFYMGIHGVCVYNGGSPQLISRNFGNRNFTNAIAGTDGDTYYLSVLEGSKPYLFAYETQLGMWILEDHVRAIDFARMGKDLYFADDDGNVWKMNSGTETNFEWFVRFAPVYEQADGRKVYSRLILNVELPRGSFMTISISADGKPFVDAATIIGSVTDTREVMLPINRCNKFEIKISGKGKMAILSITREYAVRSVI